MNECAKICVRRKECCKKSECRMWVDYSDDLNCTLISVNAHGKLTLSEVAKRLRLSIVRIKQIQDKAIQKLQKKSSLKF